MKFLALLSLLALSCSAQDLSEVVAHGEQIYTKSCATGYCHGLKGAAGGAPRLVGRHFDQAYITGVVARGVPDTGMPAFASRLPRPDLAAVIAYVATLNGIANPTVPGGPSGPAPALSPEATLGARLFSEAVRGFQRCSTCHEVNDRGVSVAPPIAKIPASAAALKALETSNVKTANMNGESMPVLVLSEGKQAAVFYDLTLLPPVQRSADPVSVKFTGGSNWRHSSAITAYDDSELTAVLTYLRTAVKP
jgi:mono/diheme cytochrome c family protein